MIYKLFLDDERSVERIYPKQKDNEWVIARSFEEALQKIQQLGMPYFISFDNDLGEKDGTPQLEGYDFAKKLVEMDMDGKIEFPRTFGWHVHSANQIAFESINSYLQNYLKMKWSLYS